MQPDCCSREVSAEAGEELAAGRQRGPPPDWPGCPLSPKMACLMLSQMPMLPILRLGRTEWLERRERAGIQEDARLRDMGGLHRPGIM
jgi:hypothetical protein